MGDTGGHHSQGTPPLSGSTKITGNPLPALELTPPSNPDRFKELINVGNGLITRFRQVGDRTDLNDAIIHYTAALELAPVGHPQRSAALINLASGLLDRFERFGDRTDLDQAIIHYNAALELTTVGHPDRSLVLTNLALGLWTRFKEVGDRFDLDQAIIYYNVALELTPVGHPQRSTILMNLASGLWTRFGQLGDRSDLDQAIIHYNTALELRPVGHPNRSNILMNLANGLSTRFGQIGDRSDLDQAIIYYNAALELTPVGHPRRSTALVNLASGLWTRFEQVGDRSDLDQAIIHYNTALELTPFGHPNLSAVLMNLALGLWTRFGKAGDRSDLDQAIIHYKAALELTPIDHPLRSNVLMTLAIGLKTRFEQVGDRSDLDQAIIHYKAALELTPVGHLNRSTALMNLAIGLNSRLRQDTDDEEHQPGVNDPPVEIVRLLRAASSIASGGSPDDRLRASLGWIKIATEWSDPSALEAYRISLALLETMLATGRSIESRHQRINSMRDAKTRSLAVDAAALALASGEIEAAVELLEQGRSVLLTQAGKYRTQVDNLQAISPRLADEFRLRSQRMETAVMSSGSQGVDISSSVERRDAVASYINISEQWTAIVEEIRTLKGFESFLRPTPFATLHTAAAHGPVILLNISKQRSDAIIIRLGSKPLLVLLPDATLEELTQMAARAKARTSLANFDILLEETWKRLVQPVVQALQNDLRVPIGSRIWWCPTGVATRFPLHAAGIYTKRKASLPDFYISSYTSTLSALIRARKGIPKSPLTSPNLLVVGQANTPGQIPLPSIAPEIDNITSIIPHATTLIGSECTRQAVLSEMQRHDWMHVACHGDVDQDHPFRSHFSLQDGPMTLLDIAGQNLQNAEFAFLAACHSAEGNVDRPDEVLHLTAGLQFAGVRSVVGTLWAMSDEVGPTISRAFYSSLLSDEEPIGSSAHALHRAVAELRRMKPSIPRSTWACFVHYGC